MTDSTWRTTHFVLGPSNCAFVACGQWHTGRTGAKFTSGWGGETVWGEVTCSHCALLMDQVRANGIEAGRFKAGHALRRHLRRLAERAK